MTLKNNEIRALRSDLKHETSEFRLSFHNNMRKEQNEFRGEINQKFKEATSELQATTERVAVAEQRITDSEEWDTAAKEAIVLALSKQEAVQIKLTELESRSRQNNLHIYGIPEESEGSNLSEFFHKSTTRTATGGH